MSLPSVAVISLGSMGIGVAKLLRAHGYPTLTSLQGRSEATKKRASSIDVKALNTDIELVEQSDVVLSIVPPEHAFKIATKIADAVKSSQRSRQGPLYFLDLNAISPNNARQTAEAIKASTPDVILIDGGIIGGPPRLKDDGSWHCPSIVVSGPHQLNELPDHGEKLAKVLNMKHVGDAIGKASGLKMCFASMTKGLTAIAIQAFTTAQRLGVHDELQDHLKQYSPKTGDLVQGGLTSMPPKAYRWIEEMRLIGETMKDEGGFESELFAEIAKVYEVVKESELGKEQTENRQRGKTTVDVAVLVAEQLDKERR